MSMGMIVLSVLSLVSTHREYDLCGFGLVVGLPGSGGHGAFTRQVTCLELERLTGMPHAVAEPLAWLLEGTGVVSAVMVTASARDDVCRGERIDFWLGPLDDTAKVKGILLNAVLHAADGKIYAVAAGPVVGKDQKSNAVLSKAGAKVIKQFPDARP